MTSDVYIKTFEALNAAPVSMQFSELFSALQQGAVDGQDNGLILSMDSKFNEVQGYYTDLGHVPGYLRHLHLRGLLSEPARGPAAGGGPGRSGGRGQGAPGLC